MDLFTRVVSMFCSLAYFSRSYSMSSKIDRRLLRDDFIDDIVEQPSLSNPPVPSFFIDGAKITQNRNYPSFPLVFNKPKLEQTDNPSMTLKNDHRERSQVPLSHANSSALLMSNDERRREIDRIIKHLYDGKLLTATHDDLEGSDNFELPIQTFSRRTTTTTMTTSTIPTTTTTPTVKTDEESKNNEVSVLIKWARKNINLRFEIF